MMPLLFKNKFFIVLCVLFSGLYFYLVANRAYVEVVIETDVPTTFKIYWPNERGLYTEKNKMVIHTRPGREEYGAMLANIRNLSMLRIDPLQHTGSVVIKKIVITQKGIRPIRLETSGEFARLLPLQQVKETHYDVNGFFVRSSDLDSQFEFKFTPEPEAFSWLLDGIRVTFLCLFLYLLIVSLAPLVNGMQFVPVALAAVFALTAVMAAITEENIHPDEYVHVAASSYYKDHWLPPRVDAELIRQTYSIYGVSRLNSHEISYFFSGKFMRLMTPFHLSDYQVVRLFNVLLLGFILLYVFRVPEARLLAVPLLISPQLWYLFSYCNSDAFALFICFFIICQFVLSGSILNRILEKKHSRYPVFSYAVMGSLFAGLFLLKSNYYPFVAFVLFYFFWKKNLLSGTLSWRASLQRFVLLVCIGLGLVGVRMASNYYVNGLDRQEKIAALREEIALPAYKPSTPLEEKQIYLYRKSRGDSLNDIIVKNRWIGKTFRSFFGVYGYFTVSASNQYYDFVRWFGTGFFMFFVGSVLIRGGWRNRILLFAVLACGGGLITASLYHSWTADFQAQGRYLVPIIPMLSILYFHTRNIVPQKVFYFFIMSMFMLSSYSFIYVALLRIPKILLV